MLTRIVPATIVRRGTRAQAKRWPRLPGLLVLALILLGGASSMGAQEDDSSDAGEAPVVTAPVVVDGRVLYSLRGSTAFPAARRAEVVADRILELARDPSFDPATLAVTNTETYSWIGPEARPVQRVTDPDATIEGTDRRVLAQVQLGAIREAIVAYRAARTREALLSTAWRAGLAIVLTGLAMVLLVWLFRTLHRWLKSHLAKRVKAVTIHSFEVVRAESITGFVDGVLRLASGVSLVAVTVFFLRYTLGLFPWTRGSANQIDDWVLSPLAVLGSGFVSKIPNLVFLAIVVVVVRYLLRAIRVFFLAIGRGQIEFQDFDPAWADPTYKLVRAGVVAFAVILAYPYIPGSSSEAFKGISIFAGVLFSLGSSSTIANILAGYAIIYRRAFREGDVVKIASMLGTVVRVRLQSAHLRSPKNEEIVIPNSTILSSEVVNYSSLAKTEGLIVHTTVGIGYETPWRQVEAMLLEAAGRTKGLQNEPKPFVLQTELGDFAVSYQINVYCNDARQMLRLRSELHRNILDLFNEHGVQIMTPAYEGDPDEPKVVPRDQWHAPPAVQP